MVNCFSIHFTNLRNNYYINFLSRKNIMYDALEVHFSFFTGIGGYLYTNGNYTF